MDGGLEGLVHISSARESGYFYRAKLSPALNPPTFDKHAAYLFSLVFQCIVDIGVRAVNQFELGSSRRGRLTLLVASLRQVLLVCIKNLGNRGN